MVSVFTALILALLLPGLASAGSMEIESDKMVFYHKESRAEFLDKVHLIRDEFELRCDRLVTYSKENKVERAEAFGNIRLKQGDITGSSNRAVLDQVKGTLTLIGDAVLEQAGSRVQGETIVHDLNREKTVVQPVKGGRTHIRIESDDTSLTPTKGK